MCAASVAVAAPRAVRGRILDAATGAPVDTASVLVERGDGAVSQSDGSFEIAVTPGTRQLTIVAPGYEAKTVALSAAAPAGGVVVELVPDDSSEVITVQGAAPEQTKPTSYQLTAEDIRQLPGAGNDVLRAVQSLPGVARIPYNFGGLVLRGQSPRDSSVFLDGIEVPIAFHFGGVTSFYPASMLEDLKITNGGFDAAWGRTQGGVVNLSTREARTDGWRAGGEVGLLHSGALAEGPLPKGGGILVGVRRSYLDAVTDPFVADTVPLPSYLDAQVRASWGDPRRAGRVIPQLFASVDRIASSEIQLTSAFVRTGVTYRKSWGKTHLEAVPWGGWNNLTVHGESDSSGEGGDGGDGMEVPPGDGNGGGDPGTSDPSAPTSTTTVFRRPTYVMGTRAELVRDTAWGHLRAGLDAQGGYLGQIAIEAADLKGKFASSLWWSDVAGYAEARWQKADGWFAVKPGVRVEHYGSTHEWVLDPRLNVQQRITSAISLRQSIGRFHQPPTPMEIEPTLGNPRLKSAYTDQLSVGVEGKLAGGIEASATAFWHYGRRQPTAAVRPGPEPEVPEPNTGGLGPIFAELLEEQFGTFDYREATGRSRSRGVEVSVKRRAGRWFGFLGYTLARSERTDDPTRFAGWRPYQLDQTHHVTAVGSVGLAHWRVGGRLTTVSGNPYSPETGMDEQGRATYDVYGGRLPWFVSLDVRADRSWRRSWGEIAFYIDVQNATNRRNVESREGKDDVRGLPILPFIGVELVPRK
jgi:Carboxypeptidase regulatory-like domain/TonB-dependent Receptor Plug Domain